MYSAQKEQIVNLITQIVVSLLYASWATLEVFRKSSSHLQPCDDDCESVAETYGLRISSAQTNNRHQSGSGSYRHDLSGHIPESSH